MKIATVTLNPAIDQTVRADGFRTNTVNRGQGMQFDAGGKGVNVASFLADYFQSPPAGPKPTWLAAPLEHKDIPEIRTGQVGGRHYEYATVVTGFLGQENAELFEQLFAHKRIEDHFVRIPGRTRIGVKIVDEANQQTTDINMPGLQPSPEAISALLGTIEQLAASCDWFALSGNLPPGAPTTIYATIITQLKKQGRHMALDTSGEALREGVSAIPTIAKPNIDELQHLVGHALDSEAAIEQAARQLLDSGIQLVVVSMGERGAMFVDQRTSLIATPPRVNVKSTVGAGDAMVAGIIAGQVQGLNLSDCARLATAFSLGAITRAGHNLPDSETLQAYAQQVSLRTLNSVPRNASL